MSLKTGNYIYSALQQDEELSNLVGDKIYPVAIPGGTKYPFIVYSNISASGEYTKDGCVGDRVSFTVMCVSETYTQGIEIAENARIAIEQISVQDDESSTGEFELVSSSDSIDSSGEVYMIILNFTAKTYYNG